MKNENYNLKAERQSQSWGWEKGRTWTSTFMAGLYLPMGGKGWNFPGILKARRGWNRDTTEWQQSPAQQEHPHPSTARKWGSKLRWSRCAQSHSSQPHWLPENPQHEPSDSSENWGNQARAAFREENKDLRSVWNQKGKCSVCVLVNFGLSFVLIKTQSPSGQGLL